MLLFLLLTEYMKCNKYKLQDYEFLLYGEKLKVPDEFELLAEDVDPSTQENKNLQIISQQGINPFVRTEDSILEEAGIRTYSDFASAYFLIKIKALNKSKKVRELVIKKYFEIIELVKNNRTENSSNTGINNNCIEVDNID